MYILCTLYGKGLETAFHSNPNTMKSKFVSRYAKVKLYKTHSG